MWSVFDFLPRQDIFELQQANKKCYETLVPRYRPVYNIDNSKRCFMGLVQKLKQQDVYTSELKDRFRD